MGNQSAEFVRDAFVDEFVSVYARRITRMIGARRQLSEEVLESRAEKLMEILEKHTDVEEAVTEIEKTMDL